MREFEREISFDSFGSNQSLFFPHFKIALDKRFYKRKHTILLFMQSNWIFIIFSIINY